MIAIGLWGVAGTVIIWRTMRIPDSKLGHMEKVAISSISVALAGIVIAIVAASVG